MPGIYTFNSAEILFDKLKKSFSNFCDDPSVEGIYDVIFPLYHLREWIHPHGHDTYKYKSESDMSKEELLHKFLHEMNEYKIVRSLCNNAKHFDDTDINERTGVLEGARAGLMRVGDSLGVTHFLVDGTEIRDIFWPVYKIYFEYFK